MTLAAALIGLPYTWFHNQATLVVVFKRLDSVVANQQWLNLYKDTRAKNLSVIGSDYVPILLIMESWNLTISIFYLD